MQERLRLWKQKKAKEVSGINVSTTSNTNKAISIAEKAVPSSKDKKTLLECNDKDTASSSGYKDAAENMNPNCEDSKYMRSHSMSQFLSQKADLLSATWSSTSSLCKSDPARSTCTAVRGAGTGTSTGSDSGTSNASKRSSNRRKTLGSIHEIGSSVNPMSLPSDTAPILFGNRIGSNSSDSSSGKGKNSRERRASSGTSTSASGSAHTVALARHALPTKRGSSGSSSHSLQAKEKGKSTRRQSASTSTCAAPNKFTPERAPALTFMKVSSYVDVTASVDALAASEHALASSQALAADLATQLADSQLAVQQAQEAVVTALHLKATAEGKAERCWNEVAAQFFINSVNEQRIQEMEIKMSHDRMNQNEDEREIKRKHKIQLKQVLEEKSEFEERAGTMIEELNEQMNSIQDMAMRRITELENDLLAKGNECAMRDNEADMLRSANMAMKLELSSALNQVRMLQKSTMSKTQALARTHGGNMDENSDSQYSYGTNGTEVTSEQNNYGDNDDDDEDEGDDGNETE